MLPRLTDDKIEAARGLLRHGLSYLEAATALGVSPDAIRRNLKSRRDESHDCAKCGARVTNGAASYCPACWSVIQKNDCRATSGRPTTVSPWETMPDGTMRRFVRCDEVSA